MPRKKTITPMEEEPVVTENPETLGQAASGTENSPLIGTSMGDQPPGEGENAPDVALPDETAADSTDASPESDSTSEESEGVVVSVDLPPAEEGNMAEELPIDGEDEVATLKSPTDQEEAAPPERPKRKRRAAQPQPPKSDRQEFFGLDFNELDRGLTQEERQEWNSIYASYRGRSALSGTIIGVDRHTISVWNRQTEMIEKQTMYCAIVVPYRVRIVIPASEMWEQGQEKPDFVFQNMVGAGIDFIITKVDRENGFAIASRRLALRAQRYFFAHRPALCSKGARLKCRVLAVGPRRCLVECYGHDIDLTQRELRYTAIPDLRDEYHPGQELECIMKDYDPERNKLSISVKEIHSNPFEGAEQRHPVGSRRQATIAGKYGGGVFCNLPDGTVCMCNYSYQHADSEFQVGDTVILVVQRYDEEKKQMYGKILTKW